MPSLRARLVSAVLRRFVKNHNRHGVAVQRNRRANRKRPSRWDASPCIATAEELGGVPSHRLTPPNADDSLVLMYLHGGAFIAGPVVLHWWFLSKLCKLTRAIGYLPDYRKAPEHHCTEGIADVERAYLAIRERHPNSRVVVLGDSAGGNLTLVLSLLLRDKGLPLPNRIAMLAPVMDATFSNPEVEKVAPFDPMLALNGVSGAARLWARDVPLDDWRLSPINATYNNLPPMHLQIGTRDLLWPDCQRFREQALTDGVRLEYIEAKDMIHVWTIFGALIPESRKAVQQLVRFIDGSRA